MEATGCPTKQFVAPSCLRHKLFYNYGHVSNKRHIEYGEPMQRRVVGGCSAFRRNLWRNLKVFNQLETRCTAGHTLYGGIFGLEFSPDGSVLVAACEQQSLLVFDSMTHRMVHTVPKAHQDCVNTIRFLSNHVFASASDDTTIRLWDMRRLTSPMQTFRGHRRWVKNIEYIQERGLLLTSAFDNCVYSWDINRWQDSEDDGCGKKPRFNKIFVLPDLMRMRLTPSCDKMIISTHWGYLVVIHDFNVTTACEDLADVKPTNYWLVCKYGAVQSMKTTEEETKLRKFRKRNRPEIILDFPTDEVETISALCPHPQGWCIVSRYSDNTENREYTCVHDIQWPPVALPSSSEPSPSADSPHQNLSSDECSLASSSASTISTAIAANNNFLTNSSLESAASGHHFVEDERVVIKQQQKNHSLPPQPFAAQMGVPTPCPRLTHYIEEPVVGRGFVKEPSFSPDGCLIASPYGFGVRLLTFDKQVNELCDSLSPLTQGGAAVTLEELEINSNLFAHSNPVLCTKFSPVHPLLVSGSLGGKLAFYQPVL